ncbi:hypothetical protein KAR91_56480 [Candidatus Pacearchaeota archaeon]|nr:hypothetical protein [Candidatus Pacearchaeota archaeon]
MKEKIWENIKFISSVILFISLIGGIAVDIIPLPAKASDLDKLAEIVRAKIEHDNNQDKNHKIDHLQNEINSIKIPFMVASKDITREAQFYIDQKELEIKKIKDR